MKKLTVYDDQTKRLEALDPSQATGIALPTARVVAARPAVGLVSGELIYETQSRQALIWDGTGWHSIKSDFLHTVATDADALAAQVPDGNVLISEATGNFFVKTTSGVIQWGIRNYPTEADLLADAPIDGSLALADDSGVFWQVHNGIWHNLSPRPMADYAAIQAWATAAEGAEVHDLATGARLHNVNNIWEPRSILTNTEAAITALTGTEVANGQVAVSTDTNSMFIFNTGAGWIGSPVRYYATEAALQADTPADGTLAFSEDTGLVYGRSGGAWRRVNSPTISVGTTPPTTPASGDIFMDDATGVPSIHDGNNWRQFGGGPVGQIIMYPSITPPPGYLLCDGSAVNQTQHPILHNLVGNNLPDLTDQFVRGARNQQDIDGFTKHQDTTRRPRNPFTGVTGNDGSHNHPVPLGSGIFIDGTNPASHAFYRTERNFTDHVDEWVANKYTGSGGSEHTHHVTITGGGDPETAPKHVRMAYMIRHD